MTAHEFRKLWHVVTSSDGDRREEKIARIAAEARRKIKIEFEIGRLRDPKTVEQKLDLTIKELQVARFAALKDRRDTKRRFAVLVKAPLKKLHLERRHRHRTQAQIHRAS
ncbi:MAG: hypothetical protein AAB483_03020 [Patescibacteria group bacterium]